MKAEILCVGTELLLGDIVNTNAAYLARELAAMGITLCPEPTVDVVRWRRRLFMFTHQKNKQRHLARHTGQAGAGICPQQRRP